MTSSSVARIAQAQSHTRPQTQNVTSIEERRFERFVATLTAVLADEDVAFRLGRARVTARLALTDLPDRTITLLFDRSPAAMSIERQSGRPDVTLEMTCADLEGVFTSGEYLPLRILSGTVVFEGEVRKLLRVLPILRSAADSTRAAG